MPANGNRFHTVASVNPWIGQVSAHGCLSVRVHALHCWPHGYHVFTASNSLPALPRTPPANPPSGVVWQGRRYPSQMHASTECYPRDGSCPALQLHAQPPVCGLLVCTSGAHQACMPVSLVQGANSAPRPRPASFKAMLPFGNAMGRYPPCRHMKSPGGRGRPQDVLFRPLERSFPPASCAMSFSSKDSCRRRLRLRQNSKCHGFRYALTVRRVCPFATREPPPLARRTVLGCSQVAFVAWSSTLQCHWDPELRAGLPANSSWSLNLTHGSRLACPCPQLAACLRGSSQSPIVSVTKELSPS